MEVFIYLKLKDSINPKLRKAAFKSGFVGVKMVQFTDSERRKSILVVANSPYVKLCKFDEGGAFSGEFLTASHVIKVGFSFYLYWSSTGTLAKLKKFYGGIYYLPKFFPKLENVTMSDLDNKELYESF